MNEITKAKQMFHECGFRPSIVEKAEKRLRAVLIDEDIGKALIAYTALIVKGADRDAALLHATAIANGVVPVKSRRYINRTDADGWLVHARIETISHIVMIQNISKPYKTSEKLGESEELREILSEIPLSFAHDGVQCRVEEIKLGWEKGWIKLVVKDGKNKFEVVYVKKEDGQ